MNMVKFAGEYCKWRYEEAWHILADILLIGLVHIRVLHKFIAMQGGGGEVSAEKEGWSGQITCQLSALCEVRVQHVGHRRGHGLSHRHLTVWSHRFWFPDSNDTDSWIQTSQIALS